MDRQIYNTNNKQVKVTLALAPRNPESLTVYSITGTILGCASCSLILLSTVISMSHVVLKHLFPPARYFDVLISIVIVFFTTSTASIICFLKHISCQNDITTKKLKNQIDDIIKVRDEYC